MKNKTSPDAILSFSNEFYSLEVTPPKFDTSMLSVEEIRLLSLYETSQAEPSVVLSKEEKSQLASVLAKIGQDVYEGDAVDFCLALEISEEAKSKGLIIDIVPFVQNRSITHDNLSWLDTEAPHCYLALKLDAEEAFYEILEVVKKNSEKLT